MIRDHMIIYFQRAPTTAPSDDWTAARGIDNAVARESARIASARKTTHTRYLSPICSQHVTAEHSRRQSRMTGLPATEKLAAMMLVLNVNVIAAQAALPSCVDEPLGLPTDFVPSGFNNSQVSELPTPHPSMN
eukprot:6201364-Pleurochrysis_carterae.AAC.2